jgi:hypothetical protein
MEKERGAGSRSARLGRAKARPYIYGAHLCPTLLRFVYWGVGEV